MQKETNPGKLRGGGNDPVPGEFDDLLKEIEQEAVPERLLELALQLQAALLDQRKRQEGEGPSADA